ncbi:lysozyme [Pseudomonas phage phiPMW]|uniref:Lysozyme n=1 Tax=Pseudomonas phage phiPMW TaxID=1815582 RepID=A0A1S5R1I9_9CAUD|nr:endolysin [Pseudomonas phage phiPMW]ANA49275.1 lysozyme [Pseudomonas phage phiPMW]
MNGLKQKLLALGLTGALASTGVIVAEHEGLVLGTYVDPVGIVTSCYGNTGKDSKGNKLVVGTKYSEAECLRQLADDLDEFNYKVKKLVKVNISDEELAAYTSFTYNVGIGNFNASTLLRKLNAGDRIGACNDLPKWKYAKGKELPGLVKRRDKEKQLCLSGVNK